MKKLFLYFLIFSLSLLKVQSQESFQIDSTSKWVQEESYGESKSLYTYTYVLTIQSDTIINDTIYYKIFVDGRRMYHEHGWPSQTTYFYEYYGAIREDSGQIALLFPDSIYSTTLYDFNITYGDTINSFVGNGLIIQDIDTLEDGRKEYFTNNSEIFIVEGVGSNLGLFNVQHLFLIPNYSVGDEIFGCYYQDGERKYVIDLQLCYWYDPTARLTEKIAINNYLYPNPASNCIKLVVDEPIRSLKIIDITGRCHKVEFESPDLVNVTSLRNGIYLVLVNNKQVFKFIKI